MPSVVNFTDCPACGRRHRFCLLTDTITAREPYDFRCPETGKLATVTPKRDGEPARYVPQGAVQLMARHAGRAA